MPFTPFHFGPGLAIKAIIPRYFSFTVFCFAQVVTDCEVAYFLFRCEYPVHRWCHTYLGATAVALVCLVVGRFICQLCISFLLARSDAPFKRYFPTGDRIPIISALTGAFIGTYSHVVLDSIYHLDMEPWMPWSGQNPLFNMVDSLALHASCFVVGVIAAWYIATHPPLAAKIEPGDAADGKGP